MLSALIPNPLPLLFPASLPRFFLYLPFHSDQLPGGNLLLEDPNSFAQVSDFSLIGARAQKSLESGLTTSKMTWHQDGAGLPDHFTPSLLWAEHG